MIAGFKGSKDILFKKELEKWKEHINLILTIDQEEDGYEGNVGLVTEYVNNLPVENVEELQAIVVGPPMMMKFSVAALKSINVREENIWVSYERKMCCGIGKCGHCKMDDTYICLEGPVFQFKNAKKLMD